MREATGDIWSMLTDGDAIIITTNGILNTEGRLVMGKGIALEAKTRVKGVDRIAGDMVGRYGNHAWLLDPAHMTPRWDMIFMPVKEHWRDPADLALIERSAHEIVKIVAQEIHIGGVWAEDHPDYVRLPNIYLPHVGCGAGSLNWSDVKPVLDAIFTDDRYVAVAREVESR